MDKVALITGAARGIGHGIALSLAKDGFDIVIADIRDNADEAISACREFGIEAIFIRGDIGKSESRRQIIEKVKSQFGRLNVLVNNAGVAPKVRADILEATEESYEFVMKINLQGPYFLTQAVANWMVSQKSTERDFQGCIVNISSISSTTASPARGEYCISKAGLSMATKLWAVRLSEYGIPVFEVRPGIIKTDMTAAVKEKYDKLIGEGLLLQKRWGLPEDVGKAVAMLVKGDLAYSTGQVVMVDGGFSMERL